MSSDVPRPTDHTYPPPSPRSTTPAPAPLYPTVPTRPSTSRDPILNWITAEPAPPFSRAGLTAGGIVLPRRKNTAAHASDGDESDRASSEVSERRASLTDSERRASLSSDDSDWGNHTGDLADMHTRDRRENTAPPARDVDVHGGHGKSAESPLLSKESDVGRARDSWIGWDGIWATVVRDLVG